MTDRIPLDHLTSDQLDALYERLEAAEQTETQRQLATAREALASATTRAARAEVALDRVRDLRDDLHGITGARYIADALDNILGQQPGPTPAEEQRDRLAALAREILYTSHNISSHDWARWREQLDTITDQEQR